MRFSPGLIVWFTLLLFGVHAVHADTPAHRPRAQLCGDYELYPYTDLAICIHRGLAPEAVCRAVRDLQNVYSRAWSACVRTSYLRDSLVRQFVAAKAAQLEYLSLQREQCIQTHGEEWCGKIP